MITTFSGLISASRSQKTFLLELEPSELVTDWTLHAGTATASNASYRSVIGDVDVVRVDEDGSVLVENSNTSLGNGQWFYSSTTLFVRVTDGGSIFGKDIVGDYKLYFGTKSKTFNDNFYHPFVESVPTISQEKENLFWGISVVGDATVRMINHDGFFDEIFDRYAWNNKNATLLLGGEDLPFGEYAGVFGGIIRNKNLTTDRFELTISDRKHVLEDAIEVESFETTVYPNLLADVAGRAIPLVYGTAMDVPVTSITDALGTGTSSHTFKAASTSTRSIVGFDKVMVNGVSVAFTGTSTAAATFNLATSVYTPGDTVTTNMRGYPLSNTVAITKDLLSSVQSIPFGSDDWDTSSVAVASSSASVFPVGLTTRSDSLLDVLGELMKSCMGTLFINNAGKLAINIWSPDIASGLTSVDYYDIADGTFSVSAKERDVRKTVRVGWMRCFDGDTYSFVQSSKAQTERLFGTTRSRTIRTLLSTKAGAATFRDRTAFLFERGMSFIDIRTKLQLATENVADRINLSIRRRASDSDLSWLSVQPVDIFRLTKNFTTNEITARVSSLRDLAAGVGHWTSDAPVLADQFGGGSATPWDPTWSDAEAAHAQANFGYWTDADGFADATDGRTKDRSRWL